jgi:hypothetical protein
MMHCNQWQWRSEQLQAYAGLHRCMQGVQLDVGFACKHNGEGVLCIYCSGVAALAGVQFTC